jgi:hypothetical protein
MMKHSKAASNGARASTIIVLVCVLLVVFFAGQMTGKHFSKQTGGSTPPSATEASQETTKAAIDAASAAKDAAAAAKAANDAAAAAKEAVVAVNNAAAGIMKLRPTETMHVPATSNVVSGNLKRPYFDYTEVVPKVFNEHKYHLCQLSDEASECWPPLKVDVDCKKLFEQYYGQMITFKSVSPVPNAIPEQEKQQYLLYGFSKLVEAYYNENFVGDGATHATWDQELIDNKTRHGELRTSPYATYVSPHVHVGLHMVHDGQVGQLVCNLQTCEWTPCQKRWPHWFEQQALSAVLHAHIDVMG